MAPRDGSSILWHPDRCSWGRWILEPLRTDLNILRVSPAPEFGSDKVSEDKKIRSRVAQTVAASMKKRANATRACRIPVGSSVLLYHGGVQRSLRLLLPPLPLAAVAVSSAAIGAPQELKNTRTGWRCKKRYGDVCRCSHRKGER
jgi:hypothetical protein